MPITFPPAVIERAVDQDSVTTYYRRVNIFESDNTTLWRGDVGTVSGSVTVDMGQSNRRSGQLVLFNPGGAQDIDIDRDTGLWYDKIIRVIFGVRSGGTDWEASVGTFLTDRLKSQDYENTISLTLRDFAKKLSYPAGNDLEWPTNHPIENIIGDIASGGGVGPAQRNLPLTGDNTSSVHTVTSNTNRWKAMTDLATAYGWDLYFDVDGILQMDVFTDPATSPPDYTFRVGEFSNIAAIDRQISDDLIRNHIIVRGETANGTPVWGEAENNLATSPTRIAKLGRRTREVDTSWVTSNAQAVQVAERFLKVQSLERFEATLDTVLIPWLDVNVTAEFDDPKKAAGDPTRYLMNRLTIPLDLSEAQVRLGRVTSVI